MMGDYNDMEVLNVVSAYGESRNEPLLPQLVNSLQNYSEQLVNMQLRFNL